MRRKNKNRKRNFVLSAIAVFFCAAAAWTVCGIASAESQVVIHLIGADLESKGATWTVNNQPVDIEFTAPGNVTLNSAEDNIEITDLEYISSFSMYYYDGYFCQSYDAIISAPDGWNKRLECVYDSDYNVSQIGYLQVSDIPQNATLDGLSLEVVEKRDYTVTFSGVTSVSELKTEGEVAEYDGNVGDYVVMLDGGPIVVSMYPEVSLADCDFNNTSSCSFHIDGNDVITIREASGALDNEHEFVLTVAEDSSEHVFNGGDQRNIGLAGRSANRSITISASVRQKTQGGDPGQPEPPVQKYAIQFDNYMEHGENGNGYYILVSSNEIENKQFTIYSDNGEFKQFGNGNYGVELLWDDYSEASFRMPMGADFDPETMQVALHGADGFYVPLAVAEVGSYYTFTLRNSGVTQEAFGVSIAIEAKHNQNPGGPDNPGDNPGWPGEQTSANIIIKSNNAYAKSYAYSHIEINSEEVRHSVCEDGMECDAPDKEDINNFTYNHDSEHDVVGNTPVVYFDVSTLFNRKIKSITINGTEYEVPIPEITVDEDDPEWGEQYANNQNECTKHFDHQVVGFRLTVPKADLYDIAIDVTEVPFTEICVSNFLWSDNEALANEDLYVAHSRIELLRVEWVAPGTPEEDEEDEKIIIEGDAIYEPLPQEYRDKGMVLEFDDGQNNPEHIGSLVVPAFAYVVMKVVPEYGYQVTGFGQNGNNVAVGDGVSEFGFNVGRGNFHIGAEVEATDDEVNAASESIKSGTIEFGGEEITEGTALLTVDDVDLSEEEMEEFQNEAGEYEISTYLNIDLDQIFYDGHGDYWMGARMQELDNEATITLELEEGVDGNKVVIVHQKHDGTYEIIPTTYDSETHTITFKTSSFSNYAIASMTVAEEASAVKTFDGIMTYVALLAISAASAAAAIAVIRKAKKEQ